MPVVLKAWTIMSRRSVKLGRVDRRGRGPGEEPAAAARIEGRIDQDRSPPNSIRAVGPPKTRMSVIDRSPHGF
jgi:hypothetical protein